MLWTALHRHRSAIELLRLILDRSSEGTAGAYAIWNQHLLRLSYREVLPDRAGIKHDQLDRNTSDIAAIVTCIDDFGQRVASLKTFHAAVFQRDFECSFQDHAEGRNRMQMPAGFRSWCNLDQQSCCLCFPIWINNWSIIPAIGSPEELGYFYGSALVQG